jgi:uncharacterized membrane protein YukC
LLFVGIVSQGWVSLLIVLGVLSLIFVIYHYFLTKKPKNSKVQ